MFIIYGETLSELNITLQGKNKSFNHVHSFYSFALTQASSWITRSSCRATSHRVSASSAWKPCCCGVMISIPYKNQRMNSSVTLTLHLISQSTIHIKGERGRKYKWTKFYSPGLMRQTSKVKSWPDRGSSRKEYCLNEILDNCPYWPQHYISMERILIWCIYLLAKASLVNVLDID
jgi:hypothetical protein